MMHPNSFLLSNNFHRAQNIMNDKPEINGMEMKIYTTPLTSIFIDIPF